MNSATQRDAYAKALTDYMAEVPIELWPMIGDSLSRSGLERAIRSRGFARFDRKRLLSSKCAPILAQMDTMLAQHLAELSFPSGKGCDAPNNSFTMKEEHYFRRRIEDLEKELRNAIRREMAYKDRCSVMESQIEAMLLRRDAFELHCETSLRTLHL